MYEPYFVARKKFLPRFDDGLVFCTYDKIDQIHRMQLHDSNFWAIPNAYLMHMDNDDKADEELHDTLGKNNANYDRQAKRVMKHLGRLICDISEKVKYKHEAFASQPEKSTLITKMRYQQSFVSYTRFFNDTDLDRDASDDNNINDLQEGSIEWEGNEEWVAHVGPTEATVNLSSTASG